MTEDLRVAVVVNPEMPLGLLANTVAAIAIGLAAKAPHLAAERLIDAAGRAIDVSSNRPVPVLQAPPEALRTLYLKGSVAGGTIVPFPAFARALHVFDDYVRELAVRDLGSEALDGVGLVGPAKWVRSLTGSLKLLR